MGAFCVLPECPCKNAAELIIAIQLRLGEEGQPYDHTNARTMDFARLVARKAIRRNCL